ncbi:MAG: hypothetical protein U0996_23145 [Planctomycetaceae bacterium]
MRGMKILLLVGCLMTAESASAAAQDQSQRPLPFPDRNVPGTKAQQELLRQLRAFLDQQQKQSDAPSQPSTEPSQAEPKNSEESGLDPAQLGRLGEALQKLKDQLPPGMIPPSLGNMPADKLQKSLSNPETQQRMRKLLEQFQRDGLLPPAEKGTNEPPLPVPPGSAVPSQPEAEKNGDSSTGNGTEEKSSDGAKPPGRNGEARRKPADDRANNSDNSSGKQPQPRDGDAESNRPNQPQNNDAGDPEVPDSGNRQDSNSSEPQNPEPDARPNVPKVPISSLKALEDFLEQLSRSANDQDVPPAGSSESNSNSNPNANPGPDPNSGSPRNTPPSGLQNPADPQSNPSVGTPPGPKQPLRRRESSRPNPVPRQQPSEIPGANPPAGNQPSPSPRGNSSGPPLNPLDSVPGMDPQGDSQSDRAQQSQQAIENLQQLLQNEALRRQAEQMLDRNSPETGSPNPLLNPRGSQPVPGQNNSQRPNDARDRIRGAGPGSERNPQNDPGTPPTSLPDEQTPDQQSIEDFIRQQMKKIQSQPNMQDPVPNPSISPNQPAPGQTRNPQGQMNNPSGQNPNQNPPRNQSAQTPPSANPANPVNPTNPSEPQKPPINIAEEVNRRGLKDTLKKIWENAKEQSRKEDLPASSAQNGQAPSSGDGINLKDVPADRLLKMLDNFSDDLEKLAKDTESNRRPDRPGRVMPQPRQTPEPPSAISELRKSASEWLSDAMPTKPSQNSGSRSTPAGMSMPSLSADFDTTPAILLAALLGLAGAAMIAGRYVRNRAAGSTDAALAALGPPLTPEQIHSRTDVVRAFHQVALKGGQTVEDWWNHRDAATSLAAAAPQKQTAVETLAEAYEHARYLPDDIPLPMEKIESARAAVRSLS